LVFVPAWRLLLQQRNQRGYTQELLQFQRSPWEKIKAENKRRWIMRLQLRAKERIEKENLLSNGSFLWWGAALLDWLLSLVHHGLGVFSSGEAAREDVR
jgi:hypothetical protein